MEDFARLGFTATASQNAQKHELLSKLRRTGFDLGLSPQVRK
jgi:hypothetical protein